MEDNSLKIGFIEEAQQFIEEMETLLLNLESSSNKRDVMDGIFRIVHNIKGSAKAVGFDHLGVFCHELETYLLEIKREVQRATRPVIDKLLFSRDQIASSLDTYKSDLDATFNFEDAFSKLKSEDAVENLNLQEGKQAASEAGVFLAAPEKQPTIASAPGDGSVRVNLKRVDKLINAVGELVVLDSVVRQQNKMKAELEVHKTMEQMGKIIREVQDLSMSLRMVPVKPLIQKLQRICRDTSGDLGKSVDFVVKGEESEIDKTILDMISDPLVHLIRNGIDHGLEKPDDRTQAGKNVTGRLELSVGHEGGQLAFRIKDDGKGLDSQKIAAKAIEKKLIATADHLTESKIFELIFAPGFSTKSEVTEVSGRGVGMDVVKTCVNTLGGKIEIKSQVGMGTEFMISLPLTVAIIEGMVVDSGKNCFIVPFSQVSETLKIANEDLNKGNEAGAMLKLRGKIYPVFVMNDLLGGKKNEKLEGTGLVIKSGKYEFIMLVDNVVGQQQIVVKQLGAELSGFRRYVGSGVLGDGKPALILDLLQLADEETNKRRVA